MCSAIVLAALLGVQTGQAEIARQREVVDSLIPHWKAVMRELARADSIDNLRRRRQQVDVDTAVVGPFMVIAPDNEAAEHFRNFRKAVHERGAMLEGLPQGEVQLFVQRDGAGPNALRFQAERSNGKHVRIYGGSPRARLKFTRIAVDNAIYDFLPPTLRAWAGDAHLGYGRESANVYRELATSPSPAVRACHKANVPACVTALGLGADSAAPLSSTARASFLMLALASGDSGSIARVRAHEASTPSEALASASGKTISRLAADWQKQIAASYVSYAGLSRASASALLWAGVALLLALRSTRRRAE